MPETCRIPEQNWLKSRLARLDKHIPLLLLAIAVGVLGGYGAVLFRFLIKGVQYLFYQNSGEYLLFAHTVPWYLTLSLPAIGGLIVGTLVSKGASEAKGHGVPEVMEAIALRDGRIRKRVALVKIAASAISIGSGGSVGREGPIVQIGSGIGSTLGQLFKVTRPNQRTLVGCGAAAGIAATFNAPIAGVLFALEVLLGDFGISAFSPVVISSVTATTIARYYFGDFPAFEVPAYELHSLWELGIYPFLGILCGLIAILFVSALYKGEDLFDLVPLPAPIKAAVGGLIMGAILLWFPQAFGVGYGAINLSLMNSMGWQLMFALIFIKILATTITIGSGGSGGVFAPSLFIGAMTGGLFGWIAQTLFPGFVASPGAYALVAMGGLVAGTTHAPITAILIIFELTSDYQCILPLMTTCILSTLVASSLKNGSIYTIKLLRRGLDIRSGMEQNILRNLRVRDFMHPDSATIFEGASIIDVLQLFHRQNVSYLHVVNRNNTMTGIISFRDLRNVLMEDYLDHLIIAKDIATTCVQTVQPDDSIQHAIHTMAVRGISQLPVTDANGTLAGTIRERDVLSAYDKAVVQRQLADK